jgi:N-acetyl-anhydromuramyl-L-alanine amidase AmpD
MLQKLLTLTGFKEPPREDISKSNQSLLWYPLAEIVTPEMKTHGVYKNNYPIGAVVHFTAGRWQTNQDALNTLAHGRKSGYSYMMISREGVVYQASPLNQWGYHCGESKHPILGTSLSRKLVGIEICAAGKLTYIGDGKYKSWYGETFLENEVATCSDENEGELGFYHRFNLKQELALFQLLLWLKHNNEYFNFDYVLGHHEISGKKALGYWRKNDPSAALSKSMNELRNSLKRGTFWNKEANNGMIGERTK